MNSTQKILFALIILMISISCNTNEPVATEVTSPQININWPSLADTPWPMNHHDPQSTGRSKYPGPSLGCLDYKIPLYGIEGSLVLDNYNNIYISDQYNNFKLHKFNLMGDLIWEAKIEANSPCTPIIGKDNIIYTSNGLGRSFFALSDDANIKWKFNKDGSYNIGINIDKEGNLYFIGLSKKLYVVSPSGNLLWELYDERFLTDANGAPTFSPNGNYLYVQGTTVSVLAINIKTRTIDWVFGNSGITSSPVVDNQGNLYILLCDSSPFKNSFISLNPGGFVNWIYDFNDEFILDNIEPTIDYNGNLYFGSQTLYSVNHKGQLRWKKYLNGKHIVSPLVSDIENNVFIGTTTLGSKVLAEHYVMSFDSNGNINWQLEIKDERILGASPAITNNKKLIFPTFRAWGIIVIGDM